MSRTIPTLAPDVEQWLIEYLSLEAAEETVNLKPDRVAPYRMLVVRADLQNRVTPISRYCRVGLQGWVIDSTGRADLGAGFDMTNNAGRLLEAAPRTGFLLDAEVDAGPYRVIDPETAVEFHYLTVLLEVAV